MKNSLVPTERTQNRNLLGFLPVFITNQEWLTEQILNPVSQTLTPGPVRQRCFQWYSQQQGQRQQHKAQTLPARQPHRWFFLPGPPSPTCKCLEQQTQTADSNNRNSKIPQTRHHHNYVRNHNTRDLIVSRKWYQHLN